METLGGHSPAAQEGLASGQRRGAGAPPHGGAPPAGHAAAMLAAVGHGPALILAPMEGMADAPMRALLSAGGGLAFAVAEFLRVAQAVPTAAQIVRHVPELENGAATATGTPVQVQLLGGDPGRLAACAEAAVAAGAAAIDLNFGCPAATVNRHDGGAALLKEPARIRAIVARVRGALPREVPVSAKLRLGWADPDDIDRNAEMAAAGGAAWLTIHGRTRMQGYRPPAYWAPIARVRRDLALPVVANGEVWTPADIRRCREESGCPAVMLGRGIIADPALATRGDGGGDAPPAEDPALAGWGPWLHAFIARWRGEGAAEGLVLGRVKQWLRVRNSRFPTPLFDRAKRATTIEELMVQLNFRAARGGAASTDEDGPANAFA